MNTGAFILDTLDTMQGEMDNATKGLTQNEIKWRPNAEANSIGFILWHMLSGEDAFVQIVFKNKPLLWISDEWYRKLNMPEEPLPVGGWDATVEQVASFPVPELKGLLDYGRAVRSETKSFLQNLSNEDFDQACHTPEGNPDSSQSIGDLMAILICEMSQHIGHIAFIRGLQRGINK